MKTSFNPLISVPSAILLGCALIALSILISGDVIKLGNKTGTTVTTTTPTGTTENTTSHEDRMKALAKELKFDTGKFNACLDAKKYTDEINRDMTDAASAGVSGTPGFIIGKSNADGTISGVRVPGAYPFTTFQAVFDGIAAGSAIETITAAEEGLEAGTASVDNDPVLGDKNAPITMIEFSDYECPFCKRHFTQVLPDIKKNYIDSGKVKLVFRDFIAVPSHNPAATVEALAAECAKEIGGESAYFKFHDAVFSKTQANGQGI